MSHSDRGVVSNIETCSCACPIPNKVQQMSEEDHRRMYRSMSELEPLSTLVKQLEAKQQVGTSLQGHKHIS